MNIRLRTYFYLFCVVVCCGTNFGCRMFPIYSVKNYPVDTPFVFDNKIILKGNLTKDEKTTLNINLVNYWADSLYAPKEQRFGFFFRIKNPPIYDSANVQRTEAFMKGYLKSLGYYNPQMKIVHFTEKVPDKDADNYKLRAAVPNGDSAAKLQNLTKKSFKALNKFQRRVTVIDTVYPGKPTIVDSLSYALDSPRLQFLADSTKKESLLQPRVSHFAQGLVGAELNRLVTLYRQKGYFLLTRQNLIAEADTVDQSLLNFSIDPFEQAQKIAEAAERKKGNPTTIITVTQRQNFDTTGDALPDSFYFRPYKNGRVYFYPEASINMLTDNLIKDTANAKVNRYNEYTMYYTRHLFYLTLLRNLARLREGLLYNEDSLYRTINNFNQLPAWKQVDYRTVIRGDSLDYYFFMSPARPGNITLSLEGSRNTGDFLSTGTLIGTSFNINYTAPNLFKSAVQYSASFSNGVEFTFDNNYPFLQTFLSSLGNTLSIPNKKIWSPVNYPIKWLHLGNTKPFNFINEYGTEKISLTGSIADRNNFFHLRTVVLSHGFEWRQKNTIYQLKFPGSIELYSLDTLPLLDSAFKQNPFLRTSFNTGTVVSMLQFGLTNTHQSKRHPANTIFWRLGAEESGAVSEIFTGLQDKIYRYIKLEAEYRLQHKWQKASLAFRASGGFGYNYGNTAKFGNTLPFFKQFFAGGPNSMRAWGLRQLGPGTSVVSDTSNFRERYGDMQFETNLEYRYPIASFGSVKIGGALFADVGNIWNIRKDAALPGAEFDITHALRSLAIGTGTGLRLDFSYFLIRLDFGIKLRDPARYENNGWLDFNKFTWKNREYAQYGVAARDNYAIQLGIGLPF